MYKIFTTERLTIRPVTVADAPFIYSLVNSPKWLQFIGDRNVHSISEAENYIRLKITPQFEKLGYGNYMVVRDKDGVLLGNCGLYDRSGLEGVDIGFAFLEQHEKKGYAYEAARKLVEVAFNEFKLSKIGAITVEDNIASQKLLKKLGLAFTKKIEIDGDELLYFEISK
ncbi:GNAT family N-acetyltransferase [Dokdonia sp. Hel_I_53]|uniref:GNAT family N-acetyltransferase n=1 Tax=Dokdonia sp. Hel_I_53 TaxID=1566287 RepID=UPI00119B7E3A|nr:GNAT family N-acetyltransferase [Dokdonia sp. Hel_I_53]TVZ52629.1 RimJ/RimL family protein N-acetyltransferase [Dokdonia sp. Hel_I_53]